MSGYVSLPRTQAHNLGIVTPLSRGFYVSCSNLVTDASVACSCPLSGPQRALSAISRLPRPLPARTPTAVDAWESDLAGLAAAPVRGGGLGLNSSPHTPSSLEVPTQAGSGGLCQGWGPGLSPEPVGSQRLELLLQEASFSAPNTPPCPCPRAALQTFLYLWPIAAPLRTQGRPHPG